MAYSYVSYPTDGVNDLFSVPFGYINKNDIIVTLNDVQVYYEWVTSSTIRVVPTPSAGLVVGIQRVTKIDARHVDFQNGTVLTEFSLDKDGDQAHYLIQENRDAIETIEAGMLSGTTVAEITQNASDSAVLEVTGLPEWGAGITITQAATAPADPNEGDVWYDSDDFNKSYQYRSGSWEPLVTALDGSLIVNGSIVGNKIAANEIGANHISVTSLDAVSANFGDMSATGRVTFGVNATTNYVTWTSLVNTTAGANGSINPSGTVDGWGQKAISDTAVNALTGCYVRAVLGTMGSTDTRYMLGLTTNAAAVDYNDLDRAIFPRWIPSLSQYEYRIYENGSLVTTLTTVPADGDIIEIRANANGTYYMVNGKTQYISDPIDSSTVYPFIDFYEFDGIGPTSVEAAASATRLVLDADNGYPLWYGQGAVNDANGIFYLKDDGTAVFNGNLSAFNGTFSGSLSAATGTFAGDLSAAGGTFSGTLSAADGTFSGSLTASAVNAVDTINIAGNAVTIPVSSYATGSIALDTGWTTVRSKTIAASGSNPHFIHWCLAVSQSTLTESTPYASLRIKCSDGTYVWGSVNGIQVTPQVSGIFIVSGSARHTPSAGNKTYYVQVKKSTGGNAGASYRSLLIMDIQR